MRMKIYREGMKKKERRRKNKRDKINEKKIIKKRKAIERLLTWKNQWEKNNMRQQIRKYKEAKTTVKDQMRKHNNIRKKERTGKK